MSKYCLYIWLLLCISSWCHAQPIEEIQLNPLLVDRSFQHIQNPEVLRSFFNELALLRSGKKKKLNVVQIGDSHVQGPYFPQYIRQGLQGEFGNAGRGFVFPYRVAQTNGAVDVKFKASGNWDAVRNVKSDGSHNIGLSGISLETTDQDFLLQMNISDEIEVTQIKLITEHPERFVVSTSKGNNVLRKVASTQNYTIQSGDYLGRIASKFNTSVKEIQRANAMTSTRIKAGQQLKIPQAKKQTQAVSKQSFIDLERLETGVFTIPSGSKELYIRPAQPASSYTLDGILIDNGQPGIEFHAIGVNGTKFADYNKFPRFFDQLSQLEPDLILISLGTNESFYHNYSEEQLKRDMDQFNRHMISRGLTGSVLLTSPPPSMKQRKKINSKATAYAYEMGVFANLNSWAFYDLHAVSRSSDAMPDWYEAGLTSTDKIHFLEKGYQLQASLLVEALIKAYKQQQK
ncbi:LysM peptidoglycan-binding domain-containing protein [Nonlabens xiamenensis]|uniref:LysM peptidoglycan-binding domain-containing protein n=1 Tax=Nonlabens xiamenensis TaxID=2341043 RepID=UPI000F613812|nr:LysM peptidoglycan-binding domain-containing protein [Nonlabens xiamenensis]